MKLKLVCLGYPVPSPHIRPSTPDPHKNLKKLNFLLVKAQLLWSCAHYFQWFTAIQTMLTY